ncbi:hypothetical protein, partial [Salipiger abyssi]|uniref:hypothetical protein n=1 Tax=Salipiger abyssi TaxID=1250539 RepID=UPI003619FA43
RMRINSQCLIPSAMWGGDTAYCHFERAPHISDGLRLEDDGYRKNAGTREKSAYSFTLKNSHHRARYYFW